MASTRIPLSSIRRQLQTIQSRIENFQRVEKQRRLTVIISFGGIDEDGLVPNLCDRPLPDWELFADDPAVVVLDLRHEYALRVGFTTVRNGIAISEDDPYFDPETAPAPPPDQRIPSEVFCCWLSQQEKIFFETESKDSEENRKIIERNG